MNIKQSAVITVAYRAEVVRAGRVVESRDGLNMIVDGGLNAIHIDGISANSQTTSKPFGCARFGTGTPTLKRGSAGVTFTTSGTGTLTVTASAGFFLADDVGRILKLDTGEEMRITAYSSSTSVTATTSDDPVTQGEEGTIHYVNIGNLAAPDGVIWLKTNSILSYNSTTNTYSCTRYGDSAAVAGAKTVTELGWYVGNFNGGSPVTGTLCGIDRLDSPIGMQAGDILRLTLNISMVMDTTAYSAGADEFAGVTRYWGDTSTANSVGSLFGESIGATTADLDISGMHTTAPPAVTYTGTSVTRGNPAPGVFTATSTFPVATSNGTLRALCLGSGYWIHKLTTPFVKDNTMTLTASFTKTYGRTLTN